MCVVWDVFRVCMRVCVMYGVRLCVCVCVVCDVCVVCGMCNVCGVCVMYIVCLCVCV